MLKMECYLKTWFTMKQKLLITIDTTNFIILYKYEEKCFNH